MKKNKLGGILFGVSGLLWIIGGISGEEWIYIPIGLCYVILGIVFAEDDKEDKTGNKNKTGNENKIGKIDKTIKRN